MKLSIIIALYNTEKFIESCIRSIYYKNTEDFQNFEVIVINDGSTDGSRYIVESLQKEFANLQLVDKENGGQSSARNIGFRLAKGDYIFCLDSDDTICPVGLNTALGYAKENRLDILPIFYKEVNESFEVIGDLKDGYAICDKVISGAYFLNNYTVSGAMWRYLYRRGIIEDHNLYLTEGIYHEDEEFVVKFFSYAKKVSYNRILVYFYTQRFGSTVNNKNKEHRKVLLSNLLTIIQNLQKHRDLFIDDKYLYRGLSLKLEQLCIGLFIRMKEDNLNFCEAVPYIDKLRGLELYPLKMQYQTLKFQAASKFFNNKIFLKLYFKL